MRHGIVSVVLLAVGLAGCVAAGAPRALSDADVKALVGHWQGWLVTDRGFTLIDFDIREDGSFTVRGNWVRASGTLVLIEGRLRFDGTGPWRGTLVPEGSGERRRLRLERDDRLFRGTLHPSSDAG